MCRHCIRVFHRENPFHRIEQWNGSFFRPADLSEVGTYILVQHHVGQPMCETLRQWCNLLDEAEVAKDNAEQDRLRCATEVPAPAPAASQTCSPGEFDLHSLDHGDFEMNDDIADQEDDCESEELNDIEGINAYFSVDAGSDIPVGAGHTGGAGATIPDNYVRVVHSNGLHYISMVSCPCRNANSLHLDLFAAQLLPTSFKRIQTLFTAQVLDLFRLSNLELKASAYQFYQLLRRLTRPMAPAEVVNLYREFRRMSRLWRWMKRLKWAGYTGDSKKVHQVQPGELAIYCPACPQPGINIPESWRDDPARHVSSNVFLKKSFDSVIGQVDVQTYICGRWQFQGRSHSAEERSR